MKLFQFAGSYAVAGAYVLMLSAGVSSTGAEAQQPASSTRLECEPNNLACLRVDIDGDGHADLAQVVYQNFTRTYFVVVTMYTGRHYSPISGSFDPENEAISLTVREGDGDRRCRHWTPGVTCGFPVSAHGLGRVLYLSHSRQGDLVLVFGVPHDYRGILRPNDDPRSDGRFIVIPAFDGPATAQPRAR